MRSARRRDLGDPDHYHGLRWTFRRLLANSLGDSAVELAPPEIHTLRVDTRHRGYAHTVFTFFADPVADLIRHFIAEPAHAETAPL